MAFVDSLLKEFVTILQFSLSFPSINNVIFLSFIDIQRLKPLRLTFLSFCGKVIFGVSLSHRRSTQVFLKLRSVSFDVGYSFKTRYPLIKIELEEFERFCVVVQSVC